MLFRKKSPNPLQRDTDADWKIIGENEPYYGVLSHERYKMSSINDEKRSEFFESGQHDVNRMIDRMLQLGEFNPKNALDFGCGVGRLTNAISTVIGTATGVDISKGMLKEARQRASAGSTFTDKIPETHFDWVVSLIVFQHIPPPRGYEIIRTLLGRVTAEGGATIQIMFGRTSNFRGSVGSRILITDSVPEQDNIDKNAPVPPRGSILMYDYDLSIVIAMFNYAGFHRIFLEYVNHGGIIGAEIYGLRKA